MIQANYYPDITTYLEAIHVSHTQKHKKFHILKFEDNVGKIPKKMRLRKLGFFQVVINFNHDLQLKIDSTRFVGANEIIVFIAPDQLVSFDVKDIKKGSNGYMLVFSADFLNVAPSSYSLLKTFPYFNINCPPVYLVEKELHNLFVDYMENIYAHFKNWDIDNLEIIRSYLTIMLFKAKRVLIDGGIKNAVNSRVEEITFLFESLITQTKREKQNLDYYANKLNFSAIYLAECVKKATGKTAKQIISEHLILESKSFLSQSIMDINEIAFQLGYSNTSRFIAFFKKNTGCTLGQYRKL